LPYYTYTYYSLQGMCAYMARLSLESCHWCYLKILLFDCGISDLPGAIVDLPATDTQ